MNYKETKQLEMMIKIKEKAEEIYNGFIKNTQLELSRYKDGKFILWSDSHNKTYIVINNDKSLTFVCDFLHENYRVDVNKESIFSGIKNNYRGICHLASQAKVGYNEYEFRKQIKSLED